VARNRYGWEKRAKEIARKQKSDEKMKKRQHLATAEATQEEPKAQEEEETHEE
jgi:hypothetical protein